MTKKDFYESFGSPLPNAVLKKYPQGNIMQYWAESPKEYSDAFGYKDDFHKFVCGHSGMDITTKEHGPVCAAHDGFIVGIKDGNTAVGGNIVHIQSDTFDDCPEYVRTTYAHLHTILVKEGQRVHKGDVIGTEGNTGFVVSGGVPYWNNAPVGKGVHLHFSLTEYKNNMLKYRNCLGDTSDPLVAITYKNPDYSGTAVLLQNIAMYLRYIAKKVGI